MEYYRRVLEYRFEGTGDMLIRLRTKQRTSYHLAINADRHPVQKSM